MRSLQRQARLAGLLYFVMALIASIGLLIVPSRVFVPGDAAATAQNIRGAEGLVRLGIASELVHPIEVPPDSCEIGAPLDVLRGV